MKALFILTVLTFIVLTLTEPVIKPQCPEDDNPNATLIKDPYHCDSYYVCLEGDPIPMKCPPGLHFNDLLKTCDYPKKAKCKPLPPPSSD
ncbi:peritrophin-1-like [Vespula maculifrons]|uniref:Peritrophin-1-like n=1 Tax=Vespula maculifrons TaxID=7453 RepID=A0ABD2C4I3_VESMC|nr:peritrophin-1-like [Vespula vulgaris]